MTVHQPQNDDLTHTSREPQPTHIPRIYRLLSTQNPVDYLRLLYWILLRPDMLKVYRIRCDIPQRQLLRQQAQWLINHLLWGAILLWIMVPMVLGDLPLPPFVSALMILSTFVAWRLGGMYIAHHESRVANRLILGAVLVAFGMVTAVTIPLYAANTAPMSVIILFVVVIVACLAALPVASIFRLKTAESLTGVTAILMAGGLSPLVFDLVEAAWIPVSIIIIAIFLVGIVEDRFDVAKHN
ncbi:MAG: hypothetical protein KC419_27020 [Anaerolineales bacterium]|nr:hypothetical protein [Anaerolineales bacterium]